MTNKQLKTIFFLVWSSSMKKLTKCSFYSGTILKELLMSKRIYKIITRIKHIISKGYYINIDGYSLDLKLCIENCMKSGHLNESVES